MGGYAVSEAAWQLRVRNWAIEPPGWRRGQRLRIAMVADLHAASFGMDERRVAQVVEIANTQGADLIALMGDFRATHHFQTRKVSIDVVAPILAGLRAPLGVYAVTGNHDWWDDREAMARRAGPCHTLAARVCRSGLACRQRLPRWICPEHGGLFSAGVYDKAVRRAVVSAGTSGTAVK